MLVLPRASRVEGFKIIRTPLLRFAWLQRDGGGKPSRGWLGLRGDWGLESDALR